MAAESKLRSQKKGKNYHLSECRDVYMYTITGQLPLPPLASVTSSPPPATVDA